MIDGGQIVATHYECELYRSIDDVNTDEWQEVCRTSQSMSLDPRFLKAVELSFADVAQFWYAIYRDDTGRAMAATCFSRCLVDEALMAPPWVQRFVNGVRRYWPGFMKIHLLVCGVPIQAICDSQLAIADEADTEGVLAGLDETAMRLARQSGWKSGCRFIACMQFSPEMAAKLEGLSRYGYRKARSVYAYQLEGDFGSFDAYLASRSSQTRRNIRKSLRRFDDAGLTCEQFRGRDGADSLFTPEVYQLYLNVLNRAQFRFECVPALFFQELARQLPDESCFTILRQGERIVAFSCGLGGGDQYALLLVGLDYFVNPDADLYINLMFRGLDQALVPGVRVVHFSATADQFKQRAGCRGAWLSVYMKAVYPPGRLFLKCLFGLFFDSRESTNAPPPAGTEHRRQT